MKISIQKREKIAEQILGFLYSKNPQPIFTSHIAEEIARDEEFVKGLLLGLKSKKLITEIKKNPKGIDYIRRSRWKLTDTAYEIYNNHQKNYTLKINNI